MASRKALGRAIALCAPKLSDARIRRMRSRFECPPLTLAGLKIKGIPLSQYAAVTRHSIDTIRVIYERLVDIYMQKGTVRDQREWLCNELKMARSVRAWGMSHKAFASEGGPFLVLACIVSNKLDLPMLGYLIEAPTFTLGIYPDGKIASRFHHDAYVPVKDYTGLINKPSDRTQVNCPIYSSIYRELCSMKVSKEAEIAIRILQPRWSGISFALSLVSGGIRVGNRRHNQGAVKEESLDKVLADFDTYGNPMKLIWNALVIEGGWSLSALAREFGSEIVFSEYGPNYPTSPDMRERWRKILIKMRIKHGAERRYQKRSKQRKLSAQR